MGAAGGVSNRRSHWRSAPKMSVCPWWIEMSLWLDFAMTVLEAQRRLFTALAGLKVFVLESLAIRLMNLVACFPTPFYLPWSSRYLNTCLIRR